MAIRSLRRLHLLAMMCGAAGPLFAQAGSPAGPVPVERLVARRAALAERMGEGVAVIRSADERSIEGDYPQDSDYRERNDFFYLTGLEAPGGWLVLIARDSGPDEAILFLPTRDTTQEQWTGVRLGAPEASRLSGIEQIRPADRAEAAIREIVFGADSPARGAGMLYVYRGDEAAQTELIRRLAFSGDQGGPAPRLGDLAGLTASLRLVKDADEIARLRRAIAITTDAQRAAFAAVKPGMWEYEVEALIEYTFRRQGAERLGFPSIIGSGANSTTLHYDKGRGRLDAGDLLVMDVGAEYGYYSADVTRTVPVNGRFTPRQRDLYRLVLATQQAAIDSVRPGITVADLNRIARTYMREHSGQLCGDAPCDRYWIHGLSHWLGMDVHDVGAYGEPLRPGMVLTIEPGIYIPAERIGIRIEDDILVTPRGGEILSAAAPRRPEEVEAAMRRR